MMDFDDHYKSNKVPDQVLAFSSVSFGISLKQARALVVELERTYITDPIVNDLLSALHQFVKDNELVK